MNYFDYESESLFGNGIEQEFTDSDENYFREAYLENMEDESFAASLEEASEMQGMEDLRRRTVKGKSTVSATTFQRTIRKLYFELHKMSRLIRTSNYSGNRVALLRKIKEMEESLSGVRNSQMLAALLGMPKIEELTFADPAYGKQSVTDTEYEFSINQLLPYLLGSGKGFSMDSGNPLSILLISSLVGGKNAAGGLQSNPILLFFLFSSILGKK